MCETRTAAVEQGLLNRSLRLLNDCNRALVRIKDEYQLLSDLCRLVVESGGYEMSWFAVAEHDAAKSVRSIAQFGDSDGYIDSLQLSWDADLDNGGGLIGTALRTGTTQLNTNYMTNPGMAPWRERARQQGFQSSVVLPLLCEKQILGAFILHSDKLDAFSEPEVQLLEELTSNLAYGLQSLRNRRELEQHRQHLENLVQERTREIAKLNGDLVVKAMDAETANSVKSTFLASMSHELRTPLNAVIGLTMLLADSSLDRHQRNYADKIQLSAQALRTLIDDILDFSKIEAGELHLEQAPLSLNTILRATAAVLGVGVRDKPIEALFDVAADIPDALIGDAMRLQQVLLNLTSNAAKFTQSGVIVVSVRCLARSVAPDGERLTLQFAVRDTGIGVPSTKLDDIFDGFVQADVSTSRLYGGSGLGLAISARLAKLMGGQIEVDSVLGQGSEFRFSVPLMLGQSEPRVAPPDIPAALSILIVDDHPLAREILTRTCAALGWQAHGVDSGAAGLLELQRSTAEGCDYDLLLLDWRMPGMDGLQMLRQANATAGIGLPLVVLMASTFELEQVVAASGDLYLDAIADKPMTPAGLFEAVSRAYSGESSAILPTPHKTDRRLGNMRILVAEDNALNQELIEQILIRAGAEVVMVSNGQAAVEALRAPSAQFNAVLMDIQMPVMDGYTATRIIREELGRVDLSIIAVTAFARPEDREKSRLAGMVGHIVKPINVEDLLNFMANERLDAARKLAPSSDPARQVRALLALPGLDVAAALNAFGDDKEKYGELLRKLVAHHGGDVAQARRLFNAQDVPGACALCHGLAGVAAMMWATELACLAAAAELALHDGKTEVVQVLFDELQAAMQTLHLSIDQFDAR